MSTPPDTSSAEATSAADLRQALAEAMKTVAKVTLAGPLTEEQRRLLASATEQLEALSLKTLPPSMRAAGPMRPLELIADDRSLPTVLVVEDDEPGLEAVKALLERHYKVLVASDATEGSRLVREAQPDVIITDLFMPGGGGMTLLEQVRADEEGSHTPVLVLSGSADLNTKIRAFESGAFDFITKPLVADELMARVRNAVRRAQALRRERLLKGTDDLTGLPNRRALRSFLSTALRDTAARKLPLTVCMIDQDGLKQINDLYGHAAGDDAIRAVAVALGSCKRGTDCAARLGGDEFAVVMPGTDRAGAQAFINRVTEQLAQNPIRVGDIGLQLGASFGVASVGEVVWEESWEDLLKRADAQLYDAKRERKRGLKLVS